MISHGHPEPADVVALVRAHMAGDDRLARTPGSTVMT